MYITRAHPHCKFHAYYRGFCYGSDYDVSMARVICSTNVCVFSTMHAPAVNFHRDVNVMNLGYVVEMIFL